MLCIYFQVFDIIIDDYDASSSIPSSCPVGVTMTSETPTATTGLAGAIASTLIDVKVWDTVHYVYLARCGYQFENQGAWFPLVPVAARWLHNSLFLPISWSIGTEPTLVLALLVISWVSFAVSAGFFFAMSYNLLGEPVASASAVLYLFNPSGAHYSAGYTEAAFAMFTHIGMFFSLTGSEPQYVAPTMHAIP